MYNAIYENVNFIVDIVCLQTNFIYRLECRLLSFTACNMTSIYVKLCDKIVMNARDYIPPNTDNLQFISLYLLKYVLVIIT